MIDCLDQIEEIRMVTDQQVRKLFQMSQDSKMNKSQSAIKSGMDEKTVTTAAAIDRLVNHSVILELNLPSYRLDKSKETKAN
jgi:hypothetical protein